MKTIEKKTTIDGNQYWWWCPGCKTHHYFTDEWKFNGDYEKPFFQPSLRTRLCHVVIKDGIIHFFGDCKHKYAGLNIPMGPVNNDEPESM